jgi:hypothetical protein
MKYHAYKRPSAGWLGYITNAAGKVTSWVALDGSIVPDSAITY